MVCRTRYVSGYQRSVMFSYNLHERSSSRNRQRFIVSFELIQNCTCNGTQILQTCTVFYKITHFVFQTRHQDTKWEEDTCELTCLWSFTRAHWGELREFPIFGRQGIQYGMEEKSNPEICVDTTDNTMKEHKKYRINKTYRSTVLLQCLDSKEFLCIPPIKIPHHKFLMEIPYPYGIL